MAHRDLLAAIAIFVNGAKGISALQLSQDLDCQYKTAFVLAQKLREAMGSQVQGRKPNGTLYQLVAGAALAHSVSREWKGYWQR
jgi:hypothetical protein